MDKRINPIDNKFDYLGTNSTDPIVWIHNPITGRLELKYESDSYIPLYNKYIDNFDMVGGIGPEYYVITVNGTRYVDCNNAILGYLDNYKVYGNSIQDGTPTPSASIEVTSVGDKTENIFDPSNAGTRYPNGWYSGINNTLENSTSLNRTILIPCKEGDVFTYKHYSDEGGARYFWLYSDTIAVGEPCSIMNGDRISTNAITTQSAPSNAKYICICFYRNQDASSRPLQEQADDFVIIRGSTAPTSYIHYGYKVPVIVGSNCGVVDIGTLNWAYRGDLGSGVFVNTNITNKQSGKTNLYCYSYTTVNKLAQEMEDGEITGVAGSIAIYIRNVKFTDATAFKQAMSGKYLYYQRTTDTSWTEPTTTNIYLANSLRKVGDYKDYIDYENQQIVRNVGVLELDGATAGKKITSISSDMLASRGYYGLYGGLSSTAFKNFIGFRCSHFASSSASTWTSANVNEIVSQGGQTSANIFFTIDENDTERNTVAGFNTWLAQQYSSGTPVIIYYPLTTPTTESITLPAIALAEGSNRVEVATDVDAGLSATYFSSQQ